jgi:predicted alpha/beta-hydrolase family hydrolase
MEAGAFRVAIESGDVTAIAYPADEPFATLLLAHGAGAGQRHAYMVGTAERLRSRGVSVVTFDFAYTERAKKLPDPNDALEGCLAAVYRAVKPRATGPLFAGGKSMGGRIASQCAAKGAIDPKGLVFLGYPLHPPGKPDQRRDRHLPDVKAPMLFVQGTRDVFGTRDEIAPLVAQLARTGNGMGTRFYEVEGGDHSHAVPKRGGVPQGEVYEGIARAIVEWMRELL